MTSATLQTIPLNRLVHSRANVRRTGRSRALDGLMASIAAHGLRQNLNVKPTSGNRFEVVAGGRRLEALRRLAASGGVDAKEPIACLVLDEADNPLEISLTENTQREEMHPDDQFVAFRDLVEQGVPVEDVAARFGVTPAIVRRRLKLAAVSPSLRAAFRDGDLTLAQMMAFALVDDHAQQEQAWAGLPEWNRGADAIRRALTAEGFSTDTRLGAFVGVEAYEAAGGAVLRNLFEDEAPILADGALVQRLAQEKLDAEAEAVRAEGWKWVEVDLSIRYGAAGRVLPQTDEETGEVAFAPEDIARAGARVMLGHDGGVSVDRGLLDAEAVKAAQPAEVQDENAPGTEQGGATALSDAVRLDLSGHRTAALRLELTRHPAIALATVVHTLGMKAFYDTYGTATCLGLSVTSERLEGVIRSPDESKAVPVLETLRKAWLDTLPTTREAFWGWCLDAPQETLLDLLALLAGRSINALQRPGSHSGGAEAHADQLAEALSLDMAKHWTPTLEGFFARLTKAQLASLLVEAGKDDEARRVIEAKKVEGAALASQTLGDGWLPEPLRSIA